jgi:hypothetical protein
MQASREEYFLDLLGMGANKFVATSAIVLAASFTLF